MSSNDKAEIKEQQPFSFALKAPKLKLMKPNITPTPFSLNDDSYSDEMDDSTDGDIPYDENNSEKFINYNNPTKIIFKVLNN